MPDDPILSMQVPWITRASGVHASPGFKIDMAIAFMASQYDAAYKSTMANDQRIQAINVLMQCVQTIIITLATEGIGAAYAASRPASAFAMNFGEMTWGRLATGVGVDIAITVVAGPALTKGFEALGADPFTAGQLSTMTIALLRIAISAAIQHRVKAAASQ